MSESLDAIDSDNKEKSDNLKLLRTLGGSAMIPAKYNLCPSSSYRADTIIRNNNNHT